MEQKPKAENNIKSFYRIPESAILSPAEKIESITKMIYSLRDELQKLYVEHELHGDLDHQIEDLKSSISILNHQLAIMDNQIMKGRAANNSLFQVDTKIEPGLNIKKNPDLFDAQQLPDLSDNYEEID